MGKISRFSTVTIDGLAVFIKQLGSLSSKAEGRRKRSNWIGGFSSHLWKSREEPSSTLTCRWKGGD